MRIALRMEAALLVLCLVVATLAKEEAMDLFLPLAVLGTPLVALATVALLVCRFVAARWLGTSRAAEGDRECTCALAAGPLGASTLGGGFDGLGAGGLDPREASPPAAELSGEQRLRRRYVAGELSDSEFQLGIMVLAKERFTRGQLSLTEYELELDRLLERTRAAATLSAATRTSE